MRQLGPLLLGLAFSSVALAADTPEKPILVLDSGGHTSIVQKVLFTPDGKELISVSDDKTIRFWDVASGRADPRAPPPDRTRSPRACSTPPHSPRTVGPWPSADTD